MSHHRDSHTSHGIRTTSAGMNIGIKGHLFTVGGNVDWFEPVLKTI